jgi:uncharacterized protein
VLTSGDIYERSAEMSRKARMPKPKAVILIHIDEIKAGDKIEKITFVE